MNRTGTIDLILAMLSERGTMTTTQIRDGLGFANHNKNVLCNLRGYAEAGYVVRGEDVPMRVKHCTLMVATWSLGPVTPAERRDERARRREAREASAAKEAAGIAGLIRRVKVAPAPMRDSGLVAKALAAQPELQRVWSV